MIDELYQLKNHLLRWYNIRENLKDPNDPIVDVLFESQETLIVPIRVAESGKRYRAIAGYNQQDIQDAQKYEWI